MNRERLKKAILFSCLQLSILSAWAQSGTLPPLSWSHEAGIYPSAIVLKLESQQGSKIYYTTNGNKPGTSSYKYKGPILVDKTSLINVVAINDSLRSSVECRTFFIGEKSSIPLVSLGVKPYILFDEQKGIFKMGPKADTLFPFFGANFWSRDEFRMHLEIFSPEGTQLVSLNGGMRMFGGMSRLFAQKSLALVARDKYGPNRIEYKAFPDKDIDRFKYLTLRNSGSDWGKSHLRDVYMTHLVKNLDFETQAFQPAHTFINGKYWGIYNIREKVNRYFLSSNTGYHKDSVEIIEHRDNVRRGNGRHYKQMIHFMERHDLNISANYEVVNSRMEIGSFIDHQIVQIFFDNRDAGGNIKYWRPNRPDGRWRWILYDTDFGMGLHDAQAYRNNSMKFHTRPDGPDWPNPPWSTFLLRSLMENQEFTDSFLKRFCDHMNTVFEPGHMKSVLDSITDLYEPEIGRHLARWKLSTSWRNTHIGRMYEFIEKRPDYIQRYIKEYFNAGNEVRFFLNQNQGGRVLINDHLEYREADYQGSYFEGMTIDLEALPYFGNQFDYWVLPDGSQSNSPAISIVLGEESKVALRFKNARHPLEGKIVINEVSARDGLAGDWIELLNVSKTSVNLYDWYLRDSRHTWRLPGYRLDPEAFVVICKDTTAFGRVFKNPVPIIGNMPFGLSQHKESLELYSVNRAPVDSFAYQISLQDTVFTLALRDPVLENTSLEAWSTEIGKGSPGRHNPEFESQQLKQKQRMKSAGFGGTILFLLFVGWVLIRFTPRKQKN